LEINEISATKFQQGKWTPKSFSFRVNFQKTLKLNSDVFDGKKKVMLFNQRISFLSKKNQFFLQEGSLKRKHIVKRKSMKFSLNAL